MRRLLPILLLLLPFAANAQKLDLDSLTRSVTGEFLDTVNVTRTKVINDYTTIGVNYGYTFCNVDFNPTKHHRKTLVSPHYASVMYTRYGKMFGYIQNFGITAGIEMGNEGYEFEPDPETGRIAHVDSATSCRMTVFEVPVMARFHLDMEPVMIMMDLGVYGGYRYSINRSGDYMNPKWQNTFKSYEHRFDYGLEGGVGMALMLDPVEIHLNAMVRWAWSSLYDPDYYSRYYYRFAYPIDIMVSLGVHFQLTKRKGKTNTALKREARTIVYGE